MHLSNDLTYYVYVDSNDLTHLLMWAGSMMCENFPAVHKHRPVKNGVSTKSKWPSFAN